MEQQIARTIYSAQILILDDQQANVHLLKSILKAAGYTRLIGITDPVYAVSQWAEIQPDIMLLDLMMPHLDGFQVMELLKPLIAQGDYLPILVLTADATRETMLRALAHGATDFLVKPFDNLEVVLRINNLLQSRFLHVELQRHNQLLEEKVQERTKELSQMLNKVLKAQETERRRISMDLHDGPLQSLAVCAMAVDRVIRRNNRGQGELVVSGLRELREMLSGTVSEVRGVLADLSLDVLNNSGLALGLREYIARFSDVAAIHVDIKIDEFDSSQIPPEIRLLMYRLAQEALSNVRKHARANNAELELKLEGDSLIMSIKDDGRGFDVDAVLQEFRAGTQIGLRSMRERIQSAQGELTISSVPGEGTSLTFRCPLSANAEMSTWLVRDETA